MNHGDSCYGRGDFGLVTSRMLSCVCGRIVVGIPLQGVSPVSWSMVISSLSKELTPHQHMGVFPIWATRS